MTDDTRPRRSDFPYFMVMQTRWNDNDIYGHMNNVVYYQLLDTAVNRYMVEEGDFRFAEADAIGLVAETRCRYFAPLRFPDIIEAGMSVTRLGNRAVTWSIGLFKGKDEDAAAVGHFVHVFVDRTEQSRTVPIPASIRAALERLVVDAG
ncbi:MAG: thioesterase [Rhodospirillaceae bacterium]|nr:thioesterase [Rhodospirillaceae bacterium]